MTLIPTFEPIGEIADQSTYRWNAAQGLRMVVLGSLLGTSHIQLNGRLPSHPSVLEEISARCPSESGVVGHFSAPKHDYAGHRVLEVHYVLCERVRDVETVSDPETD